MVLKYLARYLHRIALSNSSLLKIESNAITFRYKKTNSKTQKVTWKSMKLKPMEFLRRFLQHVLPKGMAKVRYYGFMAPTSQKRFEQMRRCLWLSLLQTGQTFERAEEPQKETPDKPPCPKCGKRDWALIKEFAMVSQKPP